MNIPKFSTLAVAGLVCFSGAAPAQTPATHHKMVASDCLAALDSGKFEKRASKFSVSVQDDIKALTESARVLAHHNRQDSCERVVDEVNAMLNQHQQKLAEQRRAKQLSRAPALADYTSTVAVGSLLGQDIVNPEGETLGSVHEVVVAPTGGQVAYVVLEYGGVVGIGDRLIQIPWSAIKATTEKNGELGTLVVDISEKFLDSRKSIGEGSWPKSLSEPWPATGNSTGS